MSRVITVSQNKEDWYDQFAPAIEALRAGELVVFPTETVYGIALRADSQSAIDKVYQIKGRPDGKPCAFHVGDWEMIEEICADLDPAIYAVMQKYLPGPFTFLVDLAGVKTGIRFPENPVAQAFLSQCKVPVKATSANLSNQPSPKNIDMTNAISGAVAYSIDAGPTTSGVDSTVVDLTQDPPVVLRQGARHFAWPQNN